MPAHTADCKRQKQYQPGVYGLVSQVTYMQGVFLGPCNAVPSLRAGELCGQHTGQTRPPMPLPVYNSPCCWHLTNGVSVASVGTLPYDNGGNCETPLRN